MKTYDAVETVLNVLGVGVGVSMIKDILGVALLVINILLLVIRVVIKVIKWYRKASKDGKITGDEVDELANSLGEEQKYLEEMKENVEEEK